MLNRIRFLPLLYRRTILFVILLLGLGVIDGAHRRLSADSGTCNGQIITLPFTDVMGSVFFCQIAEIYFQGITSGTTPTTYSPNNTVTRDQMAAFLSRTLDTGLQRGSNRAALDQFWNTKPHYDQNLGTTTLGGDLIMTRSDGQDVWAADFTGSKVYRVHAVDGVLENTWTGATNAYGILCAMGRVFATGMNSPAGSLYMINPTEPGNVVKTVTTGLGQFPFSLAFDGNKIWTANSGSVSIITPGPTIPWSVTNVGGFGTVVGILYDGSNIWVTDSTVGSLKKLDSNGNVIQTVTVGSAPEFPVFDGKNIWVPNATSHSVTVVRASTGEVLATLTGNGLDQTRTAAFDGERVLITNYTGNTVSLWKASDLTPLGSFSTGVVSQPWGACSDGQSFWITLRGTGRLARF